MPDIPYAAPLGVAPGPDHEQIFVASVMAVCGLLIDYEVITREAFETRVIDILDNPELLAASSVVSSISMKLSVRAIKEKMERERLAKADADKTRPPIPSFGIR